MQDNSFFANRVGVIATMHKKEQVIAPLIEQELQIKALVPTNFDTDAFGTFTREIKRAGDQLEAARRKVKQALAITEETLGFASEGTFGPHPAFSYVPCNREIVILLDQANDLEVVGQEFSLETNYSHRIIETVEEAYDFAIKIGFPEHGLVVMTDPFSEGGGEIIKGIIQEEELFKTIKYALSRSSSGKVHIETDMRAMYNPTRMKNIEKATRDLIKKLNQLCPQCSLPGFEVVERRNGLPCTFCNLPTKLTLAEIYKCKRCGFHQEVLFPNGIEKADPSQCMYCNP